MEKKPHNLQIVKPGKELKSIQPNKDKDLSKLPKPFLEELYSSFKTSLYFLVPCWLFIFLQSLSLISEKISDIGAQLFAVAIFALGIPLSIALRVDQLSLELGTQYSREMVLFIASLITGFNITIILFLRRVILTPSKTNTSNNSPKV